jgi:hypothetical protein
MPLSPPLFLLLQTGFGGLSSRFEEIFRFVYWNLRLQGQSPIPQALR